MMHSPLPLSTPPPNCITMHSPPSTTKPHTYLPQTNIPYETWVREDNYETEQTNCVRHTCQIYLVNMAISLTNYQYRLPWLIIPWRGPVFFFYLFIFILCVWSPPPTINSSEQEHSASMNIQLLQTTTTRKDQFPQ